MATRLDVHAWEFRAIPALSAYHGIRSAFIRGGVNATISVYSGLSASNWKMQMNAKTLGLIVLCAAIAAVVGVIVVKLVGGEGGGAIGGGVGGAVGAAVGATINSKK